MAWSSGLRECGRLPRMSEHEHDDRQAWYWTPDWQDGERDADEQAARGEGEQFSDGESFLASLR